MCHVEGEIYNGLCFLRVFSNNAPPLDAASGDDDVDELALTRFMTSGIRLLL